MVCLKSPVALTWLCVASLFWTSASGFVLYAQAAANTPPLKSSSGADLPQAYCMRFRFRYHRILGDGKQKDYIDDENANKPAINSFVFEQVHKHVMDALGRPIMGAGGMGGSNPDIPWWQSWVRSRSKNWIERGTIFTPYQTAQELEALEKAAAELPSIIEKKLAKEYPDEYFEWIDTPCSPPNDMVELWYTIRTKNAKDTKEVSASWKDETPTEIDRNMKQGKLEIQKHPKNIFDDWTNTKDAQGAQYRLSDAVRDTMDRTLGYFNVGYTTFPYPMGVDAPVKTVHMCLFTRRTRGKRLAKFLAKRAIRKEAARHDWFDVTFEDE